MKNLVIILVISLPLMLSCNIKSKTNLEKKAAKIHETVLTVDSHCDTPMRLVRSDYDISQYHDPQKRRSGKVDLPRMKQGGLDAEFFAVFLGQGERTPEGYEEVRKQTSEIFDAIHKMCQDHSELVELALNPDDAYRIEKTGKRIAFIGIENGYPIGKDISYVKKYYDRGARYITLCHTRNNDICDSSTDRNGSEHNGLSDFGREVVAEMNRLGMMVDVSHISDDSFYDVIETSETPVIASHSCVRSICDSPRNLTDDMIKKLAKNGGVLQICFLSSYLKNIESNSEFEKALQELREKYGDWSEVKSDSIRKIMREEYYSIREKFPQEQATVQDVVDHIDYVVKLVGINYVGVGTDFDGGGGIDGCNEVSEMGNVTLELVKRGYTKEEIRKIWGGNIMRVFNEVIDAAGKVKD
ncbi:membrane dipeptidase [candidate division KSB1 bacterium]|nr:membrane dipeptidase [candidate division KSB1 bacterium]